jgi:hypothetical protein
MFQLIHPPGGHALMDVMDKELMPGWLAAHAPGRRPSIDDFLRARVVFYPGAGDDGSPVRFFGSRHLAHTFIYADYGVGRAEVERALVERSFRGYRQLDRVELTADDLRVRELRYHLAPDDIDHRDRFAADRMRPHEAPFGFIEVLERTAAAGDAHGPARLAILFLYADGHAAYDGLFCQDWSTPPYAVVVQDHGFGGDYSSFGDDGLMHRIATRTGRLPRYLWCADRQSRPWRGYEPVPGVPVELGGVHGMPRTLYERSAARP